MPVGVVVVVADVVLTVAVEGVLQQGGDVLRVVAVIQDGGRQLLTSLNKINVIPPQFSLTTGPPCLSPGIPGSTERSGRREAWSIWRGRETS